MISWGRGSLGASEALFHSSLHERGARRGQDAATEAILLLLLVFLLLLLEPERFTSKHADEQACAWFGAGGESWGPGESEVPTYADVWRLFKRAEAHAAGAAALPGRGHSPVCNSPPPQRTVFPL